MKLIVGLGNFGKEYEKTRHNMGFDVVDLFAESLGEDIKKSGFHSLYNKVKYWDEDIILLKPQTYMNNSGVAVSETMKFFKIDLEDVLIIYDDMDISVGEIRLRKSGSSGGHNGIKSIISFVGSENFKRIRVGIGNEYKDAVDFVLGKPNKEERVLIDKAQENAVKAIKLYLKENFDKAMNEFNKKEKPV